MRQIHISYIQVIIWHHIVLGFLNICTNLQHMRARLFLLWKFKFDFMVFLTPFWKRDHPNNDNNARFVRKWIIKNIPQFFYNNSLLLRSYKEFIGGMYCNIDCAVDLIENLKYVKGIFGIHCCWLLMQSGLWYRKIFSST